MARGFGHIDGEKPNATLVAAFVELLGNGLAEAISSYEIARKLDVGQRSVGFIARAARDAGYLVGSIHGGGYFMMTKDPRDLEVTCDHMVARVRGGIARMDTLRVNWFNTFR